MARINPTNIDVREEIAGTAGRQTQNIRFGWLCALVTYLLGYTAELHYKVRSWRSFSPDNRGKRQIDNSTFWSPLRNKVPIFSLRLADIWGSWSIFRGRTGPRTKLTPQIVFVIPDLLCFSSNLGKNWYVDWYQGKNYTEWVWNGYSQFLTATNKH